MDADGLIDLLGSSANYSIQVQAGCSFSENREKRTNFTTLVLFLCLRFNVFDPKSNQPRGPFHR